MQLVHLIAAARPNFMKVAPLYHALARETGFRAAIIHTGQHYDPAMSAAFFTDLGLPEPDLHLGVGSGSHAEQTGGVMVAYERALKDSRPDWIVVVGDVNSTAACALVGAKAWIPVVHLEAGLRSRDRRMPEEINRLVTDSIADVLWTPSSDAGENLIEEGVDPERIDFVGNIMIDSYERLKAKIEALAAEDRFGLGTRPYGVVTLHRPSNVDDRDALAALIHELVAISRELPLLFPAHPRTKKRLEEFGLAKAIAAAPGVRVLEPLGYIEFMSLVCRARVAITDSGGVQEETTYLGIPCLTLRDNTERPITVSEGTNRLVRPEALRARLAEALAARTPAGRRPALWDGHAAERCVQALKRRAGLDA